MTPSPRPVAPHAAARTTRRRAGVVAAALAVAALLLSGCSLLPADDGNPSASSQEATQSSAAPSTPAGLEEFYDQDLRWKSCDGGQCATVSVPLDYDAPQDAKISLALFRKQAKGSDHDALLVNPGGPGASGVEYVRQSADVTLSQTLRSAYDIVGFDPRGVGDSTAVSCLSDAQQDKEREDARLPTDAEGIRDMLADAKSFGAACEKNSPHDLLQHVDSVSAAADLDIIRAALGQEKLDYLGFSYGTKLGALYLQQFPARAGRMVLDGALDPSLDSTEVAQGQAVAFEHALDGYLRSCLEDSDCPFSGSVDEARSQLTDFLTAADATPLSSDSGRDVPASEIVSALLLPLYEPTLDSTLTQALSLGMDGADGTALLQLADLSADRQDDGSYASNTDAAFTAINCVDYPHTSGSVAAIEARATALEKKAPFFGKIMGYDDGCSTWPADQVVKPAKVSVPDGTAPTLVVGTTEDPATPYAWAQSLSQQLTGSHLLTYEGAGHTAYGRSNSCIVDAVDGYLVDGDLPAEGKRC